MKQLSKSEIKELELQMLVQFADICEKSDIYYTLCGGTLLGAIRHKGFIPWDDDIDVIISRPDFEKLCALIKTSRVDLPPHLKFASWFTHPSLNIPFLKLIDMRTIVDEEYMVGDRHLWIDIFVIDGCPENSVILSLLFALSKFLRKILFIKQSKTGRGKNKARAIGKDILRMLVKPISMHMLCKQINRIAKSYSFSECQSIGGIQWGYGPQEKIDKTKWQTPIDVEFEGYKFHAPSNYDEYLTNLYGSYMSLPPETQRHSHDMHVMIID